MKRKRFLTIAIALSTLVAVLAFPLAGCTGGVGFPTSSGKASLSNATMCKSVDLETGEPIEPSDTFSTTTPLIFCSVKVSNATPDTKISAEWLYLQQGANDETGLLIADWNTTTEGTHYIPLSIMSPENGWPTGDYKIVLYLDGNEKTSVPFKVQ